MIAVFDRFGFNAKIGINPNHVVTVTGEARQSKASGEDICSIHIDSNGVGDSKMLVLVHGSFDEVVAKLNGAR